VFLYPTPQALVAEGLAMTALEQVGAPSHTEGVVLAVREALLPIRANIAMLMDEGAMSLDEARAYARRWMLESDAHVAKAVDGVVARSWQPYGSCYVEGLRLCRAFVAREPDGFRRLLAEPLTPADLA
jgi:hypothetical protein